MQIIIIFLIELSKKYMQRCIFGFFLIKKAINV